MSRMHACFQSMAKTVLPFGRSSFVVVIGLLCGKRFITWWLCCMYEIALRPVTTVALSISQASPCGIYGGHNGIGSFLLRGHRFRPVIAIPLMPRIHYSTHIPVTMCASVVFDTIVQ